MQYEPQISFAHSSEDPVDCDAAVVMDVLRAFTTASYAFLSGASEILIARSPDHARKLKSEYGDLATIGEVRSIKPPDFDFGNSPVELEAAQIHERRLVQATSSGTRGLVAYQKTPLLFACSFACVAATAKAIRSLRPDHVALVSTGPDRDGADEDRACAEYLAELIRGQRVNPDPYLDRVRSSNAAKKFLDPNRPELDSRDVDYALKIDVTNFALKVIPRGTQMILQRFYVDQN